jgi:LCP family protein required for cell wall assembly
VTCGGSSAVDHQLFISVADNEFGRFQIDIRRNVPPRLLKVLPGSPNGEAHAGRLFGLSDVDAEYVSTLLRTRSSPMKIQFSRTSPVRRIVALVGAAALVVGAASQFATQSAGAAAKAPVKPKAKPNAKPYAPNGRAPKAAGPFLWEIASTDPSLPSVSSFEAATTKIVPNSKIFSLLVIGSDARPGENFQRTRGDAISLIVWNPAWNKGIIVGFPRDAYVAIPGKGNGKITSALALGGPSLLLQTVNSLSRLNTQNYVVTGFAGFTKMVNDIGGVNVLVDPAMNDKASGALFAKGWFAMNGNAALAFNRNRKGIATGASGRALNNGRFLIYTLAKLREEVTDVNGLIKWIKSMQANAATNLKTGDLLVLAQMARSIDPNNMQNIVLQGKNIKVKSGKLTEDAVLLNPSYFGFFTDIGHDAVNDGR